MKSKDGEREELEQQLQWVRKKSMLLEEIEIRLKKMRSIVEYAAEYDISVEDRSRLNKEILQLQEEIRLLEQQVQPFDH